MKKHLQKAYRNTVQDTDTISVKMTAAQADALIDAYNALLTVDDTLAGQIKGVAVRANWAVQQAEHQADHPPTFGPLDVPLLALVNASTKQDMTISAAEDFTRTILAPHLWDIERLKAGGFVANRVMLQLTGKGQHALDYPEAHLTPDK